MAVLLYKDSKGCKTKVQANFMHCSVIKLIVADHILLQQQSCTYRQWLANCRQ